MGRAENNVGKGENAGYQHFLPFPQCFLKASFTGSLTLYQTNPVFCKQSLLKTLGKGDIANNEHFLLFSQCFLPAWRTSCHFHQI